MVIGRPHLQAAAGRHCRRDSAPTAPARPRCSHDHGQEKRQGCDHGRCGVIWAMSINRVTSRRHEERWRKFRRQRTDLLGKARGQRARLCSSFQFSTARPAEEVGSLCGRRAQTASIWPRCSNQAPTCRAARRAHHRPRRRYLARAFSKLEALEAFAGCAVSSAKTGFATAIATHMRPSKDDAMSNGSKGGGNFQDYERTRCEVARIHHTASRQVQELTRERDSPHLLRQHILISD